MDRKKDRFLYGLAETVCSCMPYSEGKCGFCYTENEFGGSGGGWGVVEGF